MKDQTLLRKRKRPEGCKKRTRLQRQIEIGEPRFVTNHAAKNKRKSTNKNCDHNRGTLDPPSLNKRNPVLKSFRKMVITETAHSRVLTERENQKTI